MNLYSLRSRTAFCVYSESGNDTGKFLNALRESPVRFFGLSVRRGRLYGYVLSKDYSRLCETAQAHKLCCEEISRKGAVQAGKGYMGRIGLVIGFILAVMLTSFLSDIVMIIEVGGNENIPTEKIISHLKDSGLSTGSRISSLDLRQIERRVIAMDKNIDWVGIKHIGSRVTVEINEITAPPELERKNTPCNIVAARDAQIKSVRLYSGMLIPMVGDGVKKGDVIVSGVVDTKYGRSYYVHSIGEITGIYTERRTFSQPLTVQETVCTGELVKKALCIFGGGIVYYSQGSPPGEYEYYETEKKFAPWGIELPVSVKEMHFRLLEKKETAISKEKACELLQEKIARYEENFLSDGEKIIDRKVTRSVYKDRLTCTAEYTLEGEIGTDKTIFAKYEDPTAPEKEKDSEKE